MNQKELKELIEFLIEKDISEFEYERGDTRVRLVRGGTNSGALAHATGAVLPSVHASVEPAAPPKPAAGAPPNAFAQAKPEPAAASGEDTDLHIVKSPIVGTFYESPSPGSAAFVKEGDQITVGQVLCIVEAMKLMNEIESDYGGTIVKRFVANGQPVEYGQQLYSVRPT